MIEKKAPSENPDTEQRAANGHNGGDTHKASADTTVQFTAPLPVINETTPGGSDGTENSNADGNGQQHEESAEHAPAHEVRPVKVVLTHELTSEVDKGNGYAGENGSTDGHDGNGTGRPPLHDVPPVRARLGNGHGSHNHNGNGNGSGKLTGDRRYDTVPDFVAAGDGEKARISLDTGEIPVGHTTSRLRDSDLAELRLRLKAEEWPLTGTAGRRGNRRELPYFMMRHRNMRARSRVGHIRAQAATRRYGNGGAVVVISRLLVVVFVLGFLTSLAGAGAGFGGVAYYLGKMPPVDPDSLAAAIAQNGISSQTTKIYDRNGTLLYDFVDEDTGRREELALKDISPLVISATIAAEDASFYSNPGIDPVAIARAVIINARGEGTSGASTITQQLARNIFMSPEERISLSPERKIKEAALAFEMTQKYSKDDILTLYLNQIPYGHRAYGIGAAALTYFGKSARDLTLPEAALLAGLPQSPSQYDPFINPTDAKTRQTYVLDQMAKQGMITPEEAATAKAVTVNIRPYTVNIQAPHFVYYVKQYLEQLYGPNASDMGLKVYTSLDLNVQHAAEKVAKDRVAELQKQKATNAAIVIMRPGTGEILAMVGSVDYNNTAIDGQVNVATSERQPGSSFKPITYATAFKQGWSPATVILDTLTGFPNPGQKDYVPKNYDGKDHGYVTVREALGNSLNIPAVKALQFAGVQNTIDTAHDMGIKGLNRGLDWYGLSLTLGGGEVTLLDETNAFATFANQGTEVDANPILKIVDSQERVINCNAAYACSADNQLQQQQFGSGNGQVLDPRIAYMITSILSDNKARTMEFGPNSPLKVSFPAAAKTGTTNDNRDSWTLGYTPDLTIGVWVGNSNNDEMLAVTGAIGAAVIWHNMMEAFYANPDFVNLLRDPDGKTHVNFTQPDGLVRASVCSAKGDVTDLFLRGSVPKGCSTYKDPKTNKQLHSAPGTGQATPGVRPTPMPGIIYPTPVP
jgi:1A family penicillin-binding protein